jgi:phloretin hydrolase
MTKVTEQDKLKSYAKYLEVEMVKPSTETLGLINQGPVDPAKATKIHNRNDLFKEGYLETETGYCVMEDGTGFVACLTKMPGVTVEMFDWWFAWHSLDNLRYQIWNPEDHYSVVNLQREKSFDSSLPYRERLWNTSHIVSEDIGLGRGDIQLNFKYPGDFGYTAEKIGTHLCGTLVCSNGLSEQAPATMTHFVREVDGGIELRSRFWMGYHIDENKQPLKLLPDGVRIPEFAPKALVNHCAKEFAHLASILPTIFAEEKEIF